MRRLLCRSIALLVRALVLAQCSVALLGCLAATSAYGQDANGIYYVPANSSDFGKAINTVLARCPVSSIGYAQCEIHLPYSNGGNWETTVTITSPGVSIVGQGSYASVFHCTVNGDCLRVYTSPFTVQQAGRYQGFSLMGSGTTNGVGIHAGEIEGAIWEDLDIQNFTGTSGAGIWLDNAHANGSVGTWTERNTFTSVHLQNSTTLLRFSVEAGNVSFGYNRFLDLRLNTDVTAGQTAIDIGTRAQVYNNTLRITLNAMPTSSPISGAVMKLEGTAEFSGDFNLYAEGFATSLFNAASGSTLYLGAASSVSWAGGPPSSILGGTAAQFLGPMHQSGSAVSLSGSLVPLPLYIPSPIVLGDATFGSYTSNIYSHIVPNSGSPANWLFGLGGNLRFSTSDNNWHTSTDGANNGAFGLLGNESGTVCLYTIPTNVPSAGQTLNTTALLSDCRLSIAPNGKVTGAGIATQGTPASSSAACTPPQIEYDSAYVYTCVAPNTWRRTPTSSF